MIIHQLECRTPFMPKTLLYHILSNCGSSSWSLKNDSSTHTLMASLVILLLFASISLCWGRKCLPDARPRPLRFQRIPVFDDNVLVWMVGKFYVRPSLTVPKWWRRIHACVVVCDWSYCCDYYLLSPAVLSFLWRLNKWIAQANLIIN